MRALFVMLAGTTLAISGPVTAQSWGSGPVPVSQATLAQMHAYRLNLLREDVLRRQQEEGGRLSEISLAEFQERLDQMNASYQRRIRNNDRLSVDAFGRPVR